MCVLSFQPSNTDNIWAHRIKPMGFILKGKTMRKEDLIHFLDMKEQFDRIIEVQKQVFNKAFSAEIEFIEDQFCECDALDWEEGIDRYGIIPANKNRVVLYSDTGARSEFEILDDGTLELCRKR